MKYVIWLSVVFSSMAAATPFDLALLSWPVSTDKLDTSAISYSNMFGLWYKKDGQELSQNERDLSFRYITTFKSIDLNVHLSSYDRSTEYKNNGNHFNFIDADNNFKIEIGDENYTVGLGNKTQLIAIKLNNSNLSISRVSHERKFELDVQSELTTPKPGQFVFDYRWQDYSWIVGIKNPYYSVIFEQYQNNDDDQKISLSHQSHHWQHELSRHKINLNYGDLALVDTEYKYGALSWFSKGEVWHYSLTNERKNRWWKVSIIDSNIENRSAGAAGLTNVIGVNAALAGANWYYGLKADFKNAGIKFGRGWQASNVLSLKDARWEHAWNISLNKLQPNVNSKVYKSVILIGTPNLENEEQTSIEYLYGAGLNWQSKLIWQEFAMTLSVSQFIPITIKENSIESESDSGGNSGNETGPANSSTRANRHVGYTLGLDLIYSF